METFVLDMDGVFTDGSFFYSTEGKILKKFGADDTDALALLSNFVQVRIVSADHRGFGIGNARFSRDLGFDFELVPAEQRLSWIDEHFGLSKVAYMGDSFKDAKILSEVAIGIAPNNASQFALNSADYVTKRGGGNGAVAEACFWLADKLGFELLD